MINELIKKASEYIHSDIHLNMIIEAFNFAKSKHEGQFRKSGEPYIIHPFEVAKMLVDYKVGTDTICAGLMHDLIEDTDVTEEEITEKFNKSVSSIVQGVTKIGQITFTSVEKKMASNHRKIIVAMSKDIRVILVKLIDRIHNIRTLDYLRETKQKRIAKETLDIYAPLAHRLGMQSIKTELEDNSFKYLFPDEYKEIQESIDLREEDRINHVDKMTIAIKTVLGESQSEFLSIENRVKNTYSIFKKMKNKNKDFSEIYDLLAIRVLVNTIEDCYRVLGIIHSSWIPIPNRFKDYIAIPKPNLYQSLHTTIMGVDGRIYEIQIRTKEMDEIAELGIAAHWAYKEGSERNPDEQHEAIVKQFKWFRELREKEFEFSESEDFMDSVKGDLFSANVYIFTPNGDVYDFPNGSTPLDFSYRIHTDLGNKTIAAIINNKIQPLTYKLKTGDVVEIKKSSTISVNTSWLKIAKTTYAKQKIKNYLNKIQKEKAQFRGMKIFEKENKKAVQKITLTNDLVEKIFGKTSIKTVDQLYIQMGMNRVSYKKIHDRIFKDEINTEEFVLSKIIKKRKRINNKSGVNVVGIDNLKITISKCCKPVNGDEIIGYISRSKGVVVHRTNCSSIKQFDDNKKMEVFWNSDNKEKTFMTEIVVSQEDKPGVLLKVINILSNKGLNITSINSIKGTLKTTLTKISFQIIDLITLNDIIARINEVKDVINVKRVIN